MNKVNEILSMLSGDALIDVFILAEDESLIEMIVAGTEYNELMKYLNENY